MKRQAGSTLKPFVYATPMDLRLLDTHSLLDDSEADITVSLGKVYHPKNYDQTFRGPVSVGEALGSSINVPAVRALQLVGVTRFLERLRTIGFSIPFEDDYFGPSLALGAVDVSLWELTQGYRQFATRESPFSGSSRESIFNILAFPEYRRFTFGIDSILTLPFPAAVKTGTSKDMRDNWCIGWTPRFTVGVWVRNFDGKPMWNVSGMTGAGPVWRQIMLALHKDFPAGDLGKHEEPGEVLKVRSLSRIKYPAHDMLVGIDPDIPMQFQKLPIEIENPQIDQSVYLNQRFFSKGKATSLWPIKSGKYLVELRSNDNQTLDSVKFEVR